MIFTVSRTNSRFVSTSKSFESVFFFLITLRVQRNPRREIRVILQKVYKILDEIVIAHGVGFLYFFPVNI